MLGALVIPVDLPRAEIWLRGELGDAALVLESVALPPAEAVLICSLFGGRREVRQLVQQLRALVRPETEAVIFRTSSYELPAGWSGQVQNGDSPKMTGRIVTPFAARGW